MPPTDRDVGEIRIKEISNLRHDEWSKFRSDPNAETFAAIYLLDLTSTDP